jgi:hypothetical protein
MDKVIIQYNMGRYSKVTKTTDWKTLPKDELYKKMNKITQSYIVKMLGINGTLDILNIA